MLLQKTILLTAPDLSCKNIREKIVCIRSHRERIFKTQAETIGNQTIFHNYGHGGAGWTFLFGSVSESMRQFEDYVKKSPHSSAKSITIIGAGCYGLLTVIMLKRQGYNVKIIAQETKNIASYKAAGFFFPRPRKNPTIQERELFLALGLESYRAYTNISNGSHEFIRQGARLMPCYFGLDIDPGFQPYIQEHIMEAPEPVTIDFQNGKTYDTLCYKTVFIDIPALMQELERNFHELAIERIHGTVESFSDLEDDIIFNCSGIGAKQLTHDKLLVPVQGHLISLRNRSMDYSDDYMINVKVTMVDSFGRTRDKLLYYAPKENGILGITFVRGEGSLDANQHEFDDLLTRARDFFGAI